MGRYKLTDICSLIPLLHIQTPLCTQVELAHYQTGTTRTAERCTHSCVSSLPHLKIAINILNQPMFRITQKSLQ